MPSSKLASEQNLSSPVRAIPSAIRAPSTPFSKLVEELNLNPPSRAIPVAPACQVRVIPLRSVQPDLFVRVLRVKHIRYYAVPALALSCLFQVLWIRLGIRVYKRCKARRQNQDLDTSNATAQLIEIVVQP